MKKILSLILALSLVVCLAACGAGSSNAGTSNPPADVPPASEPAAPEEPAPAEPEAGPELQSGAILFNGQELTDADGNPVEAIIADGTAYVPVEAMSSAMGAKNASWDEESGTVVVNDYETLFQARRVYDEEEDTIYAYRVYIPVDYDKEKEYPVVVALHGGGNRGTDNRSQLTQLQAQVWVDKQLSGEIEDVIVVAPQQHPKYGFFLDSNCVLDVLDDVEANYSVDKTRIYLTGTSMGGMGSWSTAAAEPDRFAAILASAGVYPDARYTFPVGIIAPAFEGDVEKVVTPDEEWQGAMEGYASALKDMPVWMFHSKADSMAPVAYTEYMETCMQNVGATNCTFTYFEDVAHGQSYQTIVNEYPEAIEWLLSQHK